MKYGAFIILIVVGLTTLITLFQNLLLSGSDFSILFWTFEVLPSVPLLFGFVSGVILTITLFIALRTEEASDWGD